MFSENIYDPFKYAKVEEERRFLMKTLPEDLNLESVSLEDFRSLY